MTNFKQKRAWGWLTQQGWTCWDGVEEAYIPAFLIKDKVCMVEAETLTSNAILPMAMIMKIRKLHSLLVS